MTTDSWDDIVARSATKGELFADLVETHDTALPQRWLNDLTDYCEQVGNGITYHQIRCTTVWCYGGVLGYPKSCCTEVAQAIESFQDYCNGIHPRKRPKRDPLTAE